MNVRPALVADAPALARLRWAFRAAEGAAVEDEAPFVARCARWMAGHLAEERWRCWLAEEEGTVVGQAWLQLVEKIPNPVEELEVLAYVTNVHVAPEARGGTGEELVRAMFAFLSDHPVATAVLWPTERSVTLYQRWGFDPPATLLEAPRGPSPRP